MLKHRISGSILIAILGLGVMFTAHADVQKHEATYTADAVQMIAQVDAVQAVVYQEGVQLQVALHSDVVAVIASVQSSPVEVAIIREPVSFESRKYTAIERYAFSHNRQRSNQLLDS